MQRKEGDAVGRTSEAAARRERGACSRPSLAPLVSSSCARCRRTAWTAWSVSVSHELERLGCASFFRPSTSRLCLWSTASVAGESGIVWRWRALWQSRTSRRTLHELESLQTSMGGCPAARSRGAATPAVRPRAERPRRRRRGGHAVLVLPASPQYTKTLCVRNSLPQRASQFLISAKKPAGQPASF